LRQNAQLDVLRHELGKQSRMLAEVRDRLPAELAGHVVSARSNPPELILFSDNSAWAARLRFQAPQLLADLRRAMPSLASVRVKILQPERLPRDPAASASLSESAGRAIREAGEYIADPALREALLRLARARRR
jgi:hypothetical protein